MKVLILYGTTEGQTRKIAEFVANRLRDRGDAVTLTDAADAPWDLRPSDFEAAILAGSLHAGIYQSSLIHFARKHHEQLKGMRALFLSVSLSAAGKDPDELKGIAVCADRFRNETGWTNAEVHHVAGAFRFAEYDFFKRWVMKIIAWERNLQTGGVVELELTDWDGLAKIVDDFRKRAADPLPASAA